MQIIDFTAWQLVRIMAWMQMTTLNLLLPYLPTKTLGDQVYYMGLIFGAQYIYSTPVERIPKFVRDKLMKQGYFLLGFLIVLILI